MVYQVSGNIAYKRTLAVNPERVAHVVAVDFLSHYMSDAI